MEAVTPTLGRERSKSDVNTSQPLNDSARSNKDLQVAVFTGQSQFYNQFALQLETPASVKEKKEKEITLQKVGDQIELTETNKFIVEDNEANRTKIFTHISEQVSSSNLIDTQILYESKAFPDDLVVKEDVAQNLQKLASLGVDFKMTAK